MNRRFLAVGLFAVMFLSSIMQPFLSANNLNDKNNQKVEEGFELIYDNITYSITYPLEKSLKRNVTVVNTGDTYLELEFTYHFLELNATWPGWPWRVYLDPGETQTLWVLLDPFWGDFGSLPGNYARTIEVKGYPVENPSSPIAKSVTLYNQVTVISQDDVPRNSLVYGFVYDNATKQPIESVEVELLAASSIYSLRGGTQINGSYSIPCPAHNFTVRIELTGYETFHKIIHTPKDACIRVDAYLDKCAETANYTLKKTANTTLPLWRYDVSDDEKYFAASQGHFENVGAWFPNLTGEYIENNSYIYLFDLSNDSLLWQYPVHSEVWCVDVSGDGNYIAAPIVNSEKVLLLNRSGNIVWDTSELGYERMLSDEVKISHNNKYAAVGYNPGYLCLLNLSTGEKIWGNYTPFTEGIITQIAFNEDDTHIYVGSGDGYLYLFNASNGAMIWRTYIGTWPYRIHSLVVTPDESYIATGSKLGEVCLIGKNGTLLWNFDMMGCVGWVDISPDKKYVTVNSGGWYGSAVFDIDGNMVWYDSRLACGGSVTAVNGRKYMLGGTGPSTYAGVWNQNGTALWSYHGEIPCGCLFYMTKNCSKMIASSGDGCLYFFEGGITSSSEESAQQGDWEKESGIRVPDGVSSCTVVMQNVSTHIITYRMYYTGMDSIYSAFSEDGLTWTVEDGVRVGPGEPGSNQERVCNCAVTGFPGFYRMIYEGVQGEAPNDIHRFFSANSTDGLNWVKEDGIRLESVGTSDYGQVSVPDIIELSDSPNGSLRMFYVGDFYHQSSEGNSIRSAISYDFGLTWTREGSMLLGEDTMDPDVIKRGGEYRMFYTSPQPGQKPGHMSIYSALSENGLTWWNKEFGSRVVPGGAYDTENCMDPDVIELPNGSYRMYYSGMNLNGEINILSALRLPFSIEGNFTLDFSETQFNFTNSIDRLYFKFKCTNTGTKSIFGNMEECCAPAEEGGSYVHVATPQGTNFLAPGESTWVKILLGSQPFGSPLSPEGTYNFTLYMRCSAGPPDRISADEGSFYVNKSLQIKVINRTTLAGDVVLQGRIVDENGFPISDLEFDIGTYGGKTGTRTDAGGYFSYSIAESQAYFLVIQKAGYRGVTVEIDGDNVQDFYNITLTKETSPISINSTLINSVSGNIGFWRCAATADESKLLLVNGMENWEDPSFEHQYQSKLYLLDVNTGEITWTHDMGWESWTADITDDGKYAIFGTNLQWPETGPEGFINYIRLLNGTGGSTIWQKNITSENFPEYFKDGQSYTRGVKFSHSGEYIIVAVEPEYVYLLNRSDGSIKWRKWVSQNVREILFTQDDQYVYISGGNGQLHKVRVNDGSEVWKQWSGAWAQVNGLDLSADEQYIAVGAKGSTLSVINTTDGSVRFSGDGGTCRISPDGTMIAVGGDPALKVVDLDGNLLWRYYLCDSADIRFSGDGSLIFVGSGEVFNAYGTLVHEVYNTQGRSQIGWLNSNGTRFIWAVRDTPASENNIIEVYKMEINSTPQIEEGDWIKESGIRTADGSVPYVLRLDNGSYRLYYNNPDGIFSAISEDGLNFIKENGTRLKGTGIPGDSEWQAHGATVIKLDNGSYRMYYIGATSDGGPGQAIHRIYSAISNDGLNFVREGIRIESNGTIDNGWASVPEIVRTFDGKYRLYYCTMGAYSIGSAISDDGLNFVREYGSGIGNGTGVYGADPAVCKLSNGTYRMFFTSPGGAMPPWNLSKGIYSAWSEDGRNFTLESGVRVLPSGIYDSMNVFDPAVIQLPNGSFRMYYGGESNQGVVTLSAVSSEPLVEADKSPPEIKDVQAVPETQMIGSYVNIICIVTDNVAVNVVKVNITYPNGTTKNITMMKVGTNSYSYNTSYSVSGSYSYYIWADDISGNQNKSATHQFIITTQAQDATKPEISNVQANPSTQTQGGAVNITCTVTDNVAVDNVCVDVTGPAGFTPLNTTTTNIAGTNNYYYDSTYSIPGDYSYSIWANDTSNNQNISSAYQFTITVSAVPILMSVVVKVDDRDINITALGTGTINVSPVALPHAPPENLHHIGIRINVTITGTLSYANITIKYNNSDVENIEESKLRMYYWDGSQWQLCNNTGVDTDNNIVWANITHLTIFAPMAEKVSEMQPQSAPVNLLLYIGISAIIVIIIAVSSVAVVKRKKKLEGAE